MVWTQGKCTHTSYLSQLGKHGPNFSMHLLFAAPMLSPGDAKMIKQQILLLRF